jgi:hypothetical protein
VDGWRLDVDENSADEVPNMGELKFACKLKARATMAVVPLEDLEGPLPPA